MEFLQIYNRRLNQWSARHDLSPSYSEHWKIDKTTDSGEGFKFVVNAEPDIQIADWVRVMHVADVENRNDPATYDANGFPLNHTQYIVGGFQVIEEKKNGEWIVSMQLLEPIERTKGITGETLTYTNQTEKTFNDIVYVKEPYNHYTALERWLKVTPANCDTYESGYNKNNNKSWFNRIKIFDEEWLKTLPFTNATQNELNLYGLLLTSDNCYDTSTGRTPVMYFDIDPSTDLPYNPARDEYVLKFERQDGFDKPVLDFYELISKRNDYEEEAGDVKQIQEWENYATGLVCNAENISAGAVIEYPAQGLYAAPEANTEKRATTASPFNAAGDNWIIRFPHKIKNIKLLKRTAFNTAEEYKLARTTTDLTDKVLEKKQYLASPTSPEGENERFWYEEGSNILHIKEYYYANTGLVGYLYYIEYEPLPSCRLIVGSEEHTQQINQSFSQVDAQKFSAFMYNYQKGMNKSDIIFDKHYYRYEDFANHLGCRVKKGDKTYTITSISYLNRQFVYQVIYQLNENHARKNNAYQANQEIRKNTEISTKGIKERKTAIRQIIKLGLTPQAQEGYQFLVDKKIALSALMPQTIASKYYPQTALITINSKLKRKSDNAIIDFEIDRLTSVVKFKFKNQINLNFNFFDNADAGKSKSAPPQAGDLWEQNTARIASQVPIIYTDPFGEVQYCKTRLASLTTSALQDINSTYDNNQTEWNKSVKVYKAMLELPLVSSDIKADLLSNVSVETPYQNIFKDQLEDFDNNIIIEPTSSELIICENLSALSRLLKQSDTDETVFLRYYSQPKAENDNLSDYLVGGPQAPESITSTSSTIVYTLTPSNITYNSIIISTIAGKKLLILNDISATIKAQIAAGTLTLYYA